MGQAAVSERTFHVHARHEGRDHSHRVEARSFEEAAVGFVERWHAAAALKRLRRLIKNQGIAPETVVTDGLRSYGAAMDSSGSGSDTDPGDCERTTASRTATCRCADASG